MKSKVTSVELEKYVFKVHHCLIEIFQSMCKMRTVLKLMELSYLTLTYEVGGPNTLID